MKQKIAISIVISILLVFAVCLPAGKAGHPDSTGVCNQIHVLRPQAAGESKRVSPRRMSPSAREDLPPKALEDVQSARTTFEKMRVVMEYRGVGDQVSAREFARGTGLKAATVSRILKGNMPGKPRPNTILKIAEALLVTPALFGYTKPTQNRPIVDFGALTDDIKDVLKSADKPLSPSGIRKRLLRKGWDLKNTDLQQALLNPHLIILPNYPQEMRTRRMTLGFVEARQLVTRAKHIMERFENYELAFCQLHAAAAILRQENSGEAEAMVGKEVMPLISECEKKLKVWLLKSPDLETATTILEQRMAGIEERLAREGGDFKLNPGNYLRISAELAECRARIKGILRIKLSNYQASNIAEALQIRADNFLDALRVRYHLILRQVERYLYSCLLRPQAAGERGYELFRCDTYLVDVRTEQRVPVRIREIKQGRIEISVNDLLIGSFKYRIWQYQGTKSLHIEDLQVMDENRRDAGERRQLKCGGWRLMQAAALISQVRGCNGAINLWSFTTDDSQRFYATMEKIGLTAQQGINSDTTVWYLTAADATRFIEGIERLIRSRMKNFGKPAELQTCLLRPRARGEAESHASKVIVSGGSQACQKATKRF